MLPLSFEASDELVLIAIVVVVGDVTDDGERSLDDVTNHDVTKWIYKITNTMMSRWSDEKVHTKSKKHVTSLYQAAL